MDTEKMPETTTPVTEVNDSPTTDKTGDASTPAKASSQAGNIILAILMAAIGLTFIWLCDRHIVGSTILTIGGLAFILPGATLLLSLLGKRKESNRGSAISFITTICGIAAILLGIIILAVPDYFRPLLVYLFGGLLIVATAWQFNVMMRKNRGALYPVWLTISPVAIVILGVTMITMDIFKGETNEKWMLLATGCGFTLFSLISLFISYYAIKAIHAAKAKAADKTEKSNDSNTLSHDSQPKEE